MLWPTSFTNLNIPVSSIVNISGVRGGSGPPLLLIHGYPQTKEIWNQIAPVLSQHYTVIALDLRGYGQSSKPQAPKDSPDDHSLYAKSVMASDMVACMKHLGFERFFLVGHDRGARVSQALATEFPHAVKAMILLDIVPILAHFDQTDQRFATMYWHWFFLIQAAPFPEDVITRAPEVFANKQMGPQRLGGGKHLRGEEEWKVYESQFHDWKSVHAMCEDYRAGAKEDMVEQRANLEQGKKIQCPTRVLWGKKGVIEILYDALKEWSKVVADGKMDMQKSMAVDSGHFIAEELPDLLVSNIKEFFVE